MEERRTITHQVNTMKKTLLLTLLLFSFGAFSQDLLFNSYSTYINDSLNEEFSKEKVNGEIHLSEKQITILNKDTGVSMVMEVTSFIYGNTNATYECTFEYNGLKNTKTSVFHDMGNKRLEVTFKKPNKLNGLKIVHFLKD